MTLRTGLTTGTCAAAAARAAALALCGEDPPSSVEIDLPTGQSVSLPILRVELHDNRATAVVRKDAGDDPDVTHNLEIHATLWFADAGDIAFLAGEGVGIITKPGLQLPPGEPAINPTPRQMIRSAVRSVTSWPLCIQISIPNGRSIAASTFNPRLGIEGGLSILGTTGIVRPYCRCALHDALQCTLNVAAACDITAPVLVPGNIGAAAVRKQFHLRDEQLIEAGNEWAFLLDRLPAHPFRSILIAGHPGKLAKFLANEWDTHSSRSASALAPAAALYEQLFSHPAPATPTVEGLFASLDDSARRQLGDSLAAAIRRSAEVRLSNHLPVAIYLVNMSHACIGAAGDFSPWQ